MITRVVIPRLLQLIVLFLLVAILGFLLLHAAPGDPAHLVAGLYASPEQIRQVRHNLGLDRPMIVQLLVWVGHLFTGQLGTSYSTHRSVNSVLAGDVGPTVQLTVSALVLTVLVGLPLGVLSAMRANRGVDKAARMYALVGNAVPNFVFGLLLVLLFGWWVPDILPYQGYVSFFSEPAQAFAHGVLPAACLAIGPIGVVARQTRTSMLEVLGQQYVTAARALGVSRREIIWKDALKPALMPVITVLGLLVGLLFSGTVVIEDVFAIPGLGRQLVDAFSGRDYPVAIGVMLVFATAFLVVSFLTDLAYAAVNPRVRRAYASG